MRLFGRKKRGGGQGAGDGAYLLEFAKTRSGVEAYLEAPAEGGKPTVVLVDADGVWTRRRVPNAQLVHKFGAQLGLPVHDVETTGYPERMQATSVDDVARPA
ncbi:MAG: hypothetical protein M3400_10250 [Actinomycetota bacterium]|nr:hypothetical protein [Actinomycetota bacterium]